MWYDRHICAGNGEGINDGLPVAVKARDKKTEITLVNVRMEGADGID